MSLTTPNTTADGSSSTTSPPADADRSARRSASSRSWSNKLSFRNIGAIYVLLIEIVIFSIWLPETFPRRATVDQILNSNAVTALAALAIIVPLSTRTFDLSFAYVMSLSGVTAAYFVVHNQMSVPLAMLLGIGAALIIGFVNAVVVVVMKIDSFIGTLATGSLVQAFITFVTNDISVNGTALGGRFSTVAQKSIGGITLPVFYALGVAILLWVVLEHTATGRRLYATGFNIEAARLANIRVNRLRFVSLLVSSILAGFAGVVLASTISAGSPTAGTAYLLPAFATVFVGATQFKNGRFNAWGTILAVLMLGTGIIGLALASAPPWAANMFTGVVLIAALSATGLQRRSIGRRNVRHIWGRVTARRAGPS
jgi:ribose transport system permease protein